MSADDPPSMLRRYVGIAGAAAGVLAAGAAAGVFAERKVVARRRAAAVEPFGSIRGRARTVVADDGLWLHAEVDDADDGATGRPTLVFVHGYALNLDCWHFQRRALRGQHRMVFYDQRSHGRSARSRKDRCTIEQLGADLGVVLDTLTDDGPVILIGHSMGGMTMMALAEQHPEWFGSRVVAVGLISTSSGGLKASTLGLPGMPGRLVHLVSPALVATMARAPRLVEGGRRVGSDIGFVMTRKLAFGSTVPQEYVDFTDEMLASTPIDVVADFFPGFDNHDKPKALEAMDRAPTVVIAGGRDAITPISHSRRIAEQMPSAELVELPDAGHMIMLERHDEVTQGLRRLIERVEQAADHEARP
ncbi:MAG: alpha/beta fold hydrolase [Nocardioidaceae bacterium]